MTSNWEQFRSAGSYDKFDAKTPVVLPGKPPYACLGMFVKSRGVAYVYDFGNAERTARYSVKSNAYVRDGYTFACNIYGFHFFVICRVAQPDARPTYEVHVLGVANRSMGSTTTSDLDAFIQSLARPEDIAKRNVDHPRVARYIVSPSDRTKVSVMYAQIDRTATGVPKRVGTEEEMDRMPSFPIGPLDHEYEEMEEEDRVPSFLIGALDHEHAEADDAAVEDLMTFPSGPWGAKEEEEADMLAFLDEIEGKGEEEEEENEMIEFPPAPSDSEVFGGGSLWAGAIHPRSIT